MIYLEKEWLQLRKDVIRHELLLIDKELKLCARHKIGLPAEGLVKLLTKKEM